MEESILTSTKKILGISKDYEAFDLDVITHINTVFDTLQQIGVGPEEGFSIEDDSAVWSSYLLGDVKLNSVKTYMYMRVRLMFDPPSSSFALSSMQEQINQFEWRLQVATDKPYYGTIGETSA